ncbi:MAG: hypothetical protein LBQ61_01540 [Spirochaetales bacterium]|jgi:hypothetical protein|nr:hypothetical protein [Spirochaetales bacterium]
MKRRLPGLLFFLAAGVLAADPSPALGRLYLEKAVEAERAGQREEARRLLRVAGEFQEPNSDMDFLSALFLEGTPEGTPELIRFYYHRALDKDSWLFFSPQDVLLPLAKLYFQTTDYPQVLEILDRRDHSRPPAPAPPPQPFRGPEAGEVRIRAFALDRLDRRAEAVEVLKEGLFFHPWEGELLDLLFSLSPGETARYGGFLGEDAIPGREERNRLILLLLPHLSPPEVWQGLELYRRYNLFSLSGELVRISLEGLSPRREDYLPVLERLVSAGLFEDLRLTGEAYRRLLPAAQREDLTELFRGYTGLQRGDENGDGLAELTVEVEEGRPLGVTYDPRQDGLFIYRALYQNGRPVSFQSRQPLSFYAEYEIYPWVRSLAVSTGEEIRLYDFLPGNFSLEINLWYSPFETFLPYHTPWTEDQLRASARRVRTFREGELPPREEFIPITAGEAEVYEYAPGGEASGWLYLREGVLTLEARRFLNRSWWDTLLHDNPGGLRLLLHDAGGDEYYEYREEAQEGGFSVSWDLNQNGFAECRQIIREGRLLREYSSRDDGVYDVLVEIQGVTR